MSEQNRKKAILAIPELKRYNYLMSLPNPDYDQYGFQKFATIASWTADFGDGIQADVKVCSSGNGDPLWCEAVLFHDGSEVACSDVEEELDGDWEFEYNNTEYVVTVTDGNPAAVSEKDGNITTETPSEILDEPLSDDEITRQMQEHARVSGIVKVELNDIVETDFEGFMDMLSEKLTGTCLLMDISYTVTGHAGNMLHILVSGDASSVLD